MKKSATFLFAAAAALISFAATSTPDGFTKEYAISLSKGKVSKPSADNPLAPFEQEFEMLQKEAMMNLMMMGDPFAKKTVAEQKDAYKKGAQVLKKGLDRMKKLRAKIAAKKVSAAISQDKNLLLKKVDATIAQAMQYSKMSFNDAKKLRSKGIEIKK